MHSDPTVYIIAAALVSGAIGFVTCALFASRTIRRANLEGFKECARLYQDRPEKTGL